MRKLFSFVLPFFVLLLFGLTAGAAELSNCTAELNPDTGRVTIKGVHSLKENAYITVSVEHSGVLFYFNEGATQADGSFQHTFDMDFKTDPTDIYIVKISGNNISVPVERSFGFASETDEQNLLLNLPNATDVKALFNGKEILYGIDVQNPYFVASTQKDEIYNQLKRSFSGLGQMQNAFYSALGIATFNIGKSTDTKLVEDFKAALGLETQEGSYYEMLSNKGQLVSEMSGGNYSIGDFAKFTQDFDKKAALLLVNSFDTSTRDKVLEVSQKLVSDGYISVSLDGLDYEAIKRLIELKPYQSLAEYGQKLTNAINSNSGGTSSGSNSSYSSGGGGGGVSSTVRFDTQSAPSATPNATDNPEAQETDQNKPQEGKEPFEDLGEVPWAKEGIYKLHERGIVSGIGQGVFEPLRNITRAEFVKLLVCAFDFQQSQEQLSFSDVQEDQWYYPYIAIARANDLVNGLSETQFGVDQSITREQMATMCFRALHAKGLELPLSYREMEFEDSHDISDYAQEPLEILFKGQVINGVSENRLEPKGEATRAMAVKVLYEILERSGSNDE